MVSFSKKLFRGLLLFPGILIFAPPFWQHLAPTPAHAQLASSGSQRWSQDSPGIKDASEPGDVFGSTVARGDFNGDGFDDLAVAAQAENIGSVNNAGAVNVIYGSASGLASAGDQIWTQDEASVLNAAESNDHFGRYLVSGDFNNDGFDDLAIGVPDEDIGAISGAGAVAVLYGSVSGLTASNDQYWHQNSAGILSTAETDDKFGFSLASGDFNKDGFDDLAIGVSGEDVADISDAGAVSVIYGSGAGLSAAGDQIWHQDVTDIEGGAEAGDGFGRSLASGDFNNDGFDDLAIGVPEEDVNAVTNAGAVNVIYGSGSGLNAANNQVWTQAHSGILGDPGSRSSYGFSLAAGDFDGDNFDDLAIGVPGQNFGAIHDAGAVNVIYGSSSRLTSAGNQLWSQDSSGIEGVSETNDDFGFSLTAGYFSNDGYADLAIGIPFESVGTLDDAGAVNVIYGAAAGLTSTDNQLWTEDNFARPAASDSLLGWAVAALDADGDGDFNLAVGVPWDMVGGDANAGSVVIIGDTTLPSLTVTMDNMTYDQSQVADVILNFTAGNAAKIVDVFLVIEIGSGNFTYITDMGDGASTTPAPFQSNKNVTSNQMITAFNDIPVSAVPPGTYHWYAALTEPGTVTIIGEVSTFMFTVLSVK